MAGLWWGGGVGRGMEAVAVATRDAGPGVAVPAAAPATGPAVRGGAVVLVMGVAPRGGAGVGMARTA